MKKILENYNTITKPPKIGDIVEGKVISRGRSSVFLDLGSMGTGIIYGKEFKEAKDVLKKLKIGDSILTKIINLDNEDGYIELSISRAEEELTWENLKLKKEKDENIIVKILGANKGGLLTEVSGIPAFLPVSQLKAEHYPKVEGGDTTKILKELQKFIGKELEVKIFDIDPQKGKLILSEKAKESDKIKEILKNFKVGDIVEGEITGITDFGAFMRVMPGKNHSAEKDYPLIEGLIHISELDWKIIDDPTEIVKIGDKVKAKIIDISGDKLSFSLKALKRNPWQDIEKIYKKGDIVSGKVIKFNPFGAFIQITPEIQGLCHISEFGNQHKMGEKLKIGENYNFQILEIRPDEHRLTLKLIERNNRFDKNEIGV